MKNVISTLVQKLKVKHKANDVHRNLFSTVLAQSDIEKVQVRCKEFLAPVHNKKALKDIAKQFEQQIDKSLNPATRDQSSLKCYNTHIQNISFSQEKGDYLSMYLGGTVLDFMRIRVDGPNNYTPRTVSKKVPEIMKKSSGELLFSYIAENLRDFVWFHFSFRTEHVPLVFCFSFPVEQTSLDRGTITAWAKGYRCEKTIGKNVNTLLRQAALEKGLSLDIKAIINDVGATFVVGRTKTRLCSGSIILGSGTNASYLESVKKVSGFQGDFSSPYVLLNTEWGGYGDKGELESVVTEFDQIIDSSSLDPGVHMFEKLTSGFYIGEIVRLFLVKLTEEKLIFNGKLTENLMKKGIFKVGNMSDFLTENTSASKNFLENKLNIKHTQEDLEKIKLICSAVSERSSCLIAAGIAGLSLRMAQPVVAFATEGRLINYGLPSFENISDKALALTERPVKKIYTLPTLKSPLKGSALLGSCL